MKVEKPRSATDADDAGTLSDEPAGDARLLGASPATAPAIEPGVEPSGDGHIASPSDGIVTSDGVTTLIDTTAPSRTRTRSRAFFTWLSAFHIDDRLGRLLLSIILAVLLWFYVTNLENPAQTTTFPNLNVQVRNAAKDLKVINADKIPPVDVAIEAPQDVMNGLRQSDIHPFVDLKGLDAGVHDVPVQVEANGLSGAPVTFNPDPRTVQVQLELEATSVFSVAVELTGTPLPGYEAGKPNVQPATVRVTGAKASVDRIHQVTVPMDIGQMGTTVKAQKTPVALDESGLEIHGLTFDPPLVQVEVPFTSFFITRVVPVRPSIVGQPAAGYQAVAIRSEPNSVTICCSASAVGPVQSLETSPVNISGATSTVVTTTELILPPNVDLYPGLSRSVTVTVEVQVLLSSLDLSIEPQVQGLLPGYSASLSPGRLDITVAGTLSALQALKPTDIKLIVDASGHAEGTFDLPVQATVPDGMKVQRLSQDTVSVTIVAPTPVPPTATPHPPTATPIPTAPPTATIPAVVPPTQTAARTPVPATPTSTTAPPTATHTPPTTTHTPAATLAPALTPTLAPVNPSPTATAAAPVPTSATATPTSGAASSAPQEAPTPASP